MQTQNIVLPQEVILSIQQILQLPTGPDVDPIDVLSSNFNPVESLNRLFPNDTSLSKIEAVQRQLSKDEQELRAQIAELKDEMKRGQNTSKMHAIQEMISDLMSQISLIREKATESEAVVRSITKDIQRLDTAKKNLILSTTTLKRFQMLASAIRQLEILIKENKYAEIAQTLSAIKQLSASFKPYLSVPQVTQVWSRIQALQGEVRAKTEREFETLLKPDTTKPILNDVVRNACDVVDVIGDDFRNRLVDMYCATELKEYRRIFRPADEAGQLDNISRRFAFFKRILANYETIRSSAFPEQWRIGQHLCCKFIDFTREDMTVVLEKSRAVLTVSVLMDTLRHVTEFELSICKKYNCSLSDLLSLMNLSRPAKSISSAFEPHLSVFVEAQDKAISDIIGRHKGAPARSSIDTSGETGEESTASNSVLPSSTELFYFYGQSLEQCAKLSTGQPLYDLSKVQRKWLKNYADDILLASLKTSSTVSRRSVDNRIDELKIRSTCIVINTADYAQVTTEGLEKRIIEKINEEFKGKVSFEAERSIFMGVINSAILVLLRELESACENPLATLAKVTWSGIVNVTGASVYMNNLIASIDQVINIIRPLIDQKKYLRNFFDKASLLILAKFTNALVRSRPLKEIGAEQLLFDVQALNACLLGLPGEPSTTSSYGKAVTKSTSRLENLLKVIIIPAEPKEDFILNYTLLIGDASFSNFQKVLDLKGTPRADQNDLLDAFVTITSSKSELETTSFLSSLDMEPSNTSHATNVTSPGSSGLSLPGLLTSSAVTPTEGLFSAITPPATTPHTGSENVKANESHQRREVFSDFRRFVSFGLRKDTLSS